MAISRTNTGRLRVESLEDRTTPTAGLYVNNDAGTLRITDWQGQAGNIVISQQAAGVSVTANSATQSFQNVDRIVVDTQLSTQLYLDTSGGDSRSVYVSLRDDSGKVVRRGFADAAAAQAATQTAAATPQQTATSGSAEVDEINQGQAGTCVFLSSLAAVAAAGNDLSQKVVSEGNHMYAVPLFQAGTGWTTQHVYYDGTTTVNDPVMKSSADAWVVIYQRAYLQEQGVKWTDGDSAHWGDKYGNNFRQVDQALLALTGNGSWHPFGNTAGDVGAIRDTLNGGGAVVALSQTSSNLPGTDFNGKGLIEGHSYTVLGLGTDSAGSYWVKLRNPWGSASNAGGSGDGTFWMQYSSFQQLFQGYVTATTSAVAQAQAA